MTFVVLATSSKGKITELTRLLEPIQCIPQADLNIPDVAETGESFIENALIKARHASRLSMYPALADDSGLVVDALNGRPGIYSARFAGEKASDAANIQKLLDSMIDMQPEARQAFFYCALAWVRYPDDPTPMVAVGRLDGVILNVPYGENGFGYDPVFWIPAKQKTLAELSLPEKNKISHRAQALNGLLEML